MKKSVLLVLATTLLCSNSYAGWYVPNHDENHCYTLSGFSQGRQVTTPDEYIIGIRAETPNVPISVERLTPDHVVVSFGFAEVTMVRGHEKCQETLIGQSRTSDSYSVSFSNSLGCRIEYSYDADSKQTSEFEKALGRFVVNAFLAKSNFFLESELSDFTINEEQARRSIDYLIGLHRSRFGEDSVSQTLNVGQIRSDCQRGAKSRFAEAYSRLRKQQRAFRYLVEHSDDYTAEETQLLCNAPHSSTFTFGSPELRRISNTAYGHAKSMLESGVVYFDVYSVEPLNTYQSQFCLSGLAGETRHQVSLLKLELQQVERHDLWNNWMFHQGASPLSRSWYRRLRDLGAAGQGHFKATILDHIEFLVSRVSSPDKLLKQALGALVYIERENVVPELESFSHHRNTFLSDLARKYLEELDRIAFNAGASNSPLPKTGNKRTSPGTVNIPIPRT